MSQERVQALELALRAAVSPDQIVPLARQMATFVATGELVPLGDDGAKGRMAAERVLHVVGDRAAERMTEDPGLELVPIPAAGPPKLPTGRCLDVLRAVNALQQQGAAITMYSVADRTEVDPQTANLHMNRLVDTGWMSKHLNSARNRADWKVLFPDAVPAPSGKRPATKEGLLAVLQQRNSYVELRELRDMFTGEIALPMLELVQDGKVVRRPGSNDEPSYAVAKVVTP